MPPETASTSLGQVKRENLRQLEPGESGFIDPWCLVELQSPPQLAKPDLDSAARPPEPSPHSGQFYLFPHKPVYAEPTPIDTLPVSRGADSAYSVDLSGITLPNPPRLESVAKITSGEYLACQVKGLNDALANPPPVAAAKPVPVKAAPVSSATK